MLFLTDLPNHQEILIVMGKKQRQKETQTSQMREEWQKGRKRNEKEMDKRNKCSASNWFIFNELPTILNQKSYS